MFASLTNRMTSLGTVFLQKLEHSPVGVYWSQLAARERTLVSLLAGFLVLVGLYTGLWQPMQQQQQLAQQQLISAKAQWDWLNQQIPLWEKSAFATQKRPDQTSQASLQDNNQLMGFVNQKLSTYKLQQQLNAMNLTAKGVKVSLKSVAAPKAFKWLQVLVDEQIMLNKLEIKPVEGGLIDIELLLSL